MLYNNTNLQVDYLSHQWQEEDIWLSWRSMTSQKDKIANGVRLENASWRTWWKQRNGLQTVSPETLNWLKDSDVTWLYGPFHSLSRVASSSQPLQEMVSTTSNSLRAPSCPPVQLPKSILKHRSMTELLVAALRDSNIVDSDPNESPPSETTTTRSSEHSPRPSSARVPIRKARSENDIAGEYVYRKSSSVRKTAESSPDTRLPTTTTTAANITSETANPIYSRQATESPNQLELSSEAESVAESVEPPTNPKRHVSFNTFVEQCISTEDHLTIRSHNFSSSRESSLETGRYSTNGRHTLPHWRRLDDDLEECRDDSDTDEDDSEEEEDEPIEIRPKSRRSSLTGKDSDSNSMYTMRSNRFIRSHS